MLGQQYFVAVVVVVYVVVAAAAVVVVAAAAAAVGDTVAGRTCRQIEASPAVRFSGLTLNLAVVL